MEDLKESGYFIEFKEHKPHWDKRLNKFDSNKGDLTEEIVFLVGNKPHRFKAISIWKVHRDFVYAKYAEAIKTEFAYAIKCVKIIPPSIEEVAEYNAIQVWTPEEK